MMIKRLIQKLNRLILGLILQLICLQASGNEVRITENLPFVDINYGGEIVRIERIQNQENKLTNSYAKTSRPCPHYCIHSMKVAPGVTTVAELELLDFLLTDVNQGQGLLVDARISSWYNKGTIPGAVNIPFTVLTSSIEDPVVIKVLIALGSTQNINGNWNFRNAMRLILFCNGPWCDQSPRAIKALMKLGYPPEKLSYYRGGMQLWQLFGLTTVVPPVR